MNAVEAAEIALRIGLHVSVRRQRQRSRCTAWQQGSTSTTLGLQGSWIYFQKTADPKILQAKSLFHLNDGPGLHSTGATTGRARTVTAFSAWLKFNIRHATCSLYSAGGCQIRRCGDSIDHIEGCSGSLCGSAPAGEAAARRSKRPFPECSALKTLTGGVTQCGLNRSWQACRADAGDFNDDDTRSAIFLVSDTPVGHEWSFIYALRMSQHRPCVRVS